MLGGRVDGGGPRGRRHSQGTIVHPTPRECGAQGESRQIGAEESLVGLLKHYYAVAKAA
jgi:hypothetical protein